VRRRHQGPVAQGDELGPLVAQRRQDPVDVRQGGVGFIDRVVATHGAILRPPMIGAMRPSNRMSVIGTETAFEAAARARALEASGRSVIHLEIGEPDFDTPVNVREAAKTALDEGKTHYPPFPGIPDLRAAIADDDTARKGFPVDPANVFVTVGGKGVMVYAIMALIDPGDEVIVPDPGYPIYESITNFMGGTPVPIP